MIVGKKSWKEKKARRKKAGKEQWASFGDEGRGWGNRVGRVGREVGGGGR